MQQSPQDVIAGYMQTRANHLLRSQLELIGLLPDTASGRFDAQVTQGRGNIELASSAGRLFWLRANGTWPPDRNSDSTYVFAAMN